MIEVVAIDNRTAEAELLRLAAQFAEGRLFQAKQTKRLTSVVEVTGEGQARPTSRAQLAQKPGLFKSSRHHFDCAVSLAHGFEVAVLQLMHEFVHHSQIVNNRYQLAAKTIKKDKQKHVVFQARWLGKKQGLIDDTAWQDRPWEQEASRIGEMLAGEFMALLHGTQSEFAAMGQKKELRLYEVSLALPMMGGAPAPQNAMPPASMPDAPAMTMPEMGLPEIGQPEMGAPSQAADAPQQASDDIFGDIDAILAAESAPDTLPDTSPDSVSDSLSAASSDFTFGAPMAGGDGEAGGEKRTYVAGITEPRHLKLSVLEAKKRELSERGLLEN